MIRSLAALVLTSVALSPLCGQEKTDAIFEVVQVEASNTVRYHGVDAQTVVAKEKQFVQLSGPTLFARTSTFDGSKPAFLSFFEVRKPAGQTQTLKLIHTSSEQAIEVQASAAEYVLSPAKELGNGRPADVPEQLSYLMALKIENAPTMAMTVELKDPLGSQQRKVTKPSHVCVPMQQWHHDEHFVVTDPKTCYLLFQVEPVKAQKKMATIDQFGLHELEVKQSAMVMLPVSLVE